MEARAVALCQRRQGTWLDVTELRGAGQVAMVTAGEGGALGGRAGGAAGRGRGASASCTGVRVTGVRRAAG